MQLAARAGCHVVATVADSLARRLSASGRYTVVEPDPARPTAGPAAGDADVVASISVTAWDTLSLVMIDLRDAGAAPAWARRVATGVPTGRARPLDALGEVLDAALAHLDEMDRAPRRDPRTGAVPRPAPKPPAPPAPPDR